YVYLPAIGTYILNNGELQNVGIKGFYWSSTPRPDGALNAYNLSVEKGKVHTGYGPRNNAHWLWPE
ncbi:MAG: hypothetical protein ACTTKT_01305, partial [Prevotella veroralis]